MTLLLYFNAYPAVIAAMSSGCAVYFLKYLLRERLPASSFKDELVGTGRSRMRFVCLPVGIVVFFTVLFTWHTFRKRVGCRRQSIFLDKVCIHQTDMGLKALGIKSIGAILNNSNMILLAWDRTYFDRLWCTYELA